MRAMVLERFGEIDHFKMKDVPPPDPGPDEVLVRVHAASINPIDAKTRVGNGAAALFAVVPPVILGWDLSGTVVAVGPQVVGRKCGDAVFGSVNFPGFGRTDAEYAVAKAHHLAAKPPSVCHEIAAASAMAGLTAWQALTRYGCPGPGQRVLVQAASGGVGHMAAQIAKSFGAHVTGTSSMRNRDFVLSLGVDAHIAYDQAPLEVWPNDFDLVFDAVGGETTIRSLDLLRKGGRLVTILPPREREERLQSSAAARGVEAHFHLMQSCGNDMEEIGKRLADGTHHVHIAAKFRLDELPQAHRLIDGGRTVGKIVIIID